MRPGIVKRSRDISVRTFADFPPAMRESEAKEKPMTAHVSPEADAALDGLVAAAAKVKHLSASGQEVVETFDAKGRTVAWVAHPFRMRFGGNNQFRIDYTKVLSRVGGRELVTPISYHLGCTGQLFYSCDEQGGAYWAQECGGEKIDAKREWKVKAIAGLPSQNLLPALLAYEAPKALLMAGVSSCSIAEGEEIDGVRCIRITFAGKDAAWSDVWINPRSHLVRRCSRTTVFEGANGQTLMNTVEYPEVDTEAQTEEAEFVWMPPDGARGRTWPR